jgi:hypothetical protein
VNAENRRHKEYHTLITFPAAHLEEAMTDLLGSEQLAARGENSARRACGWP